MKIFKYYLIIVILVLNILCLYICFNHGNKLSVSNNIHYVETLNKNINKVVNKYIDSEKAYYYKDSSIKREDYDFNCDTIIEDYLNYTFIHVIIYYYNGGSHYNRIDKTFIFDIYTSQELELDYFLDNNTSLEKLSLIAKNKVLKYYADNKHNVYNEMLEEGTKPDKKNYVNFALSDAGMLISFIPYQIGPWSDGETVILIPYEELKGVLKPKFSSALDNSDAISNIRDLESFKDKKLVAFTFDDGPNNTTTNYLLDNLDKYNARVTFFIVGSRIDKHYNSLIRAYNQGNQIGMHTYNHTNLKKAKKDKIINELELTNQKIEKYLGIRVNTFRPPYGSTPKSLPMPAILWSVDTLDWKTRDAIKVKNAVLENIQDGDIVLFHDLYESSINGALGAMEELYKEGYAFVTIDEMAKLRGITLQNLKYSSFHK